MPVCLKCGWEIRYGPGGCGCPKPPKLPEPLPQGLLDLVEKWKQDGFPSEPPAKSFEKMIEEDIETVMKQISPGPERDHIIQVLKDAKESSK